MKRYFIIFYGKKEKETEIIINTPSRYINFIEISCVDFLLFDIKNSSVRSNNNINNKLFNINY